MICKKLWLSHKSHIEVMHHAPPVHPLLAGFFCFLKVQQYSFYMHGNEAVHIRWKIIGNVILLGERWRIFHFPYLQSWCWTLVGWSPCFLPYGANQFKYVQLIVQETVSVSLTLWCLNLWETFCNKKILKWLWKRQISTAVFCQQKNNNKNATVTLLAVLYN